MAGIIWKKIILKKIPKFMALTDKEKIKAIEKVLDNQLLAYYVIIQEIKDILEKWKNQLKNLYD